MRRGAARWMHRLKRSGKAAPHLPADQAIGASPCFRPHRIHASRTGEHARRRRVSPHRTRWSRALERPARPTMAIRCRTRHPPSREPRTVRKSARLSPKASRIARKVAQRSLRQSPCRPRSYLPFLIRHTLDGSGDPSSALRRRRPTTEHRENHALPRPNRGRCAPPNGRRRASTRSQPNRWRKSTGRQEPASARRTPKAARTAI